MNNANVWKVVVIATPTSPILPYLLHELTGHQQQKQQSLSQITVLTRETSIPIITASLSSNHESHTHDQQQHHHHHHDVQPPKSKPNLVHIQTNLESPSSFTPHLHNIHTVICLLTGSDTHLIPSLITACYTARVQNFVPAEYGLDTNNAHIRSLLPPYERRWEVQKELQRCYESGGSGSGGRSGRMNWTVIYAGLVLDEALLPDGVLGVDCLWGSVVEFLESKTSKRGKVLAFSTYKDIAREIVRVVTRMGMREQECFEVEEGEDGEHDSGKEEIWMSSFKITLDEIVGVVERLLERVLERYEGSVEDARREAEERMKGGFWDGGVALMGRVAVWDGMDVWEGWDGAESVDQSGWEREVERVVMKVRNGYLGGGSGGGSGGCGC